ncbi:MAG: glycerophosphodiester phosphodiesterase [Thermostichus sp. BF3_bins_97]
MTFHPSEDPVQNTLQSQIIAHRGDHTQAEENTLAAFTAAIEVGADQIELDIRRSQDGIPLIFHDAECWGQPLAELTWAEIQARKPTIPTLKETLLHIQGRISLDIELKETGYEEQILSVIRDILTPEEFVITSFLPEVIQRVKTLDADLSVGLLIDAKSAESQQHPEKGSLFTHCRELGADFLAPHHSWIDAEFLTLATQARIPLYVWTVNDPEQMKVCLQSDTILGLITDHPQLALQIRAGLSGKSVH